MWNTLVVIFLSISGSFAGEMFGNCDMSMCVTEPIPEFSGHAPDVKELKIICRPLLERIECIFKSLESCTGQNVQELSSSNNASVADFMKLGLNLRDIFIDICDEDSILHAGYAANVDCFKDISEGAFSKCQNQSVAMYGAYKASPNLLGDNDRKHQNDADCLITGYVAACLSLELQKECGEIARSTVVEILRRLKFMSYSSQACSKEHLTVLKTEFLDFLDLEEQKKSWYFEVFNTRK